MYHIYIPDGPAVNKERYKMFTHQVGVAVYPFSKILSASACQYRGTWSLLMLQ